MNSNTSPTYNIPVVNVKHVGLRFGDVEVLHDINLDVYQGQTLALLGHNGAGKSSLIKLILGLIPPTTGQLTVQRGQASQQRVNLGYLPEDVSFYDKLTGWEVLSYFAALKGVKAPRVKQLLAEFELEYAQHRPLKTYSKGMKQRLGVAQAILSHPDILLLDEPTVGLDPQASQFLYQKIASLKQQGCAVIVCTHELSIVEKHLDSALLLAGGRRVGSGTLDDLRHASGLKTQIRLPNFTDKVQGDGFLQSFSHGQALLVASSERKAVIEYLVRQKFCTDFSVIEPSLEAIYHHFMQQQPLSPLPSDIAVAATSKKGWLQSLQSLFSPISGQSLL
jgi:Cu-processing system ATP-binding protein